MLLCGKSQHEVKKLIAGPSVFICDECIERNDIIRDEVHDRTWRRARGAICRVPVEICTILGSVRDRPGAPSASLSVAV